MLSAADNKLLTETGPGTPMGSLLRRYWIPVLMSEELPFPGCPPVRVKVMGEELLAVWSKDKRYALMDEHCAHRGASLFFGRNEGVDSRDGTCGLRCVYHGWKYDLDGNCIDMPNEPAASRFKQHIKLTTYPAKMRGDVLWAYLGPEGTAPDLPELEWAMVPEANRFVAKRMQYTNFVQAMEGGIDSSHVSFLHSDIRVWNPSWDEVRSGTMIDNVFSDSAPRFFIEPTDYGMLIGARRELDGGRHYWRITQWLLPWYTMIAQDGDGPIVAQAWVPIDDETSWTWSIRYHPERALTKRETESFRSSGSINAKVLPGTYIPIQNAENDYLINRTLQRTVSFTGIEGIAMQDAAMQESMGRIVDRSIEHLGSSDAAVIAARRRLIAEAKALGQPNAIPSGLDTASHRVRSTSVVLDKDQSWVDATAEARTAPHHEPTDA